MKLGQIDLIQKDGTTAEVYDPNHAVEFVMDDGRVIRMMHQGSVIRAEIQVRPRVGDFRTMVIGKLGSEDTVA